MPMSRADTIIPVLNYVSKFRPKRILDVGCGDGFYGMLFRRALDGNVEIGYGLHKRDTWQHQIDAIEIWEDYITPVHHYMYDSIQAGVDVRKFVTQINPNYYDLIFMGDVLEHMDKPDGIKLLGDFKRCLTIKPSGVIIVVTPNYKIQWMKTVNENPSEAHLSLWTEDKLKQVPGFHIETSIRGKKILGVLKNV